MSIFNDDRRVSDDIWEYSEWLQERNRECRGDDYCPDRGEREDKEDNDEP